jgi:Cu/Ag efflux protein CusF
MKTLIPLFLFFFAGLAISSAAETAKNCGCECCKGKETCCCAPVAAAAEPAKPAAPAEQPKAHPVKGVIMGVMADKTALLVKHEEVPGVMRAMTMMFKVEPAVLEKVQRGDAIKALMSRRADGWWLHEVEVIETAK